MNIEQIYNACTEEYNKNYSTGEYCHEQSFIWGWQEGVDWSNKKQLELIINWLKLNWRDYINTDKDGMIRFAGWESDLKNICK